MSLCKSEKSSILYSKVFIACWVLCPSAGASISREKGRGAVFVFLLAFWVLLNGRITTEIIILGVIICGIVDAACVKLLGFTHKRQLQLAGKSLGAVRYLVILVFEVLKAGFQVMALTLSPRAKQVQPRLVFFKSPVRSEIGRVMLSNSITLTPGTITCGLGDDMFCVHALDEAFAGGMEESVFVQEIHKLEGASND